MAPILSLATVSLNSRVSRHPPSERLKPLNGVEATLVSDRACRSSTNEQRKINIPLGNARAPTWILVTWIKFRIPEYQFYL